MKKLALSRKQKETIRILKEYWASWIPRLGRSSFQDQKILEENKAYKPFTANTCVK